MRAITLDLAPHGRQILSCPCGTIEIAQYDDWREFTVEAHDSGPTVVICRRCQRHSRLSHFDAEE